MHAQDASSQSAQARRTLMTNGRYSTGKWSFALGHACTHNTRKWPCGSGPQVSGGRTGPMQWRQRCVPRQFFCVCLFSLMHPRADARLPGRRQRAWYTTAAFVGEPYWCPGRHVRRISAGGQQRGHGAGAAHGVGVAAGSHPGGGPLAGAAPAAQGACRRHHLRRRPVPAQHYEASARVPLHERPLQRLLPGTLPSLERRLAPRPVRQPARRAGITVCQRQLQRDRCVRLGC